MCDRCESMDVLGAQVEAAVADESVPRVCSAAECEAVPLVRVAADADHVELLCVSCLVRLSAIGAVRETGEVFAQAGIRMAPASEFALAQIVSTRILAVTEVL